MLPNFLVIGAQKAGTTSLYHYLSMHPQVSIPVKEPGFFADDRVWCRGLSWYESLFAGLDRFAAVGEASTIYAMHPLWAPDVPQRIAAVIPDVRLVYVVRDPVERMRSAYQHALAAGVEHRPLRTALTDETYLVASRYAHQLDRYLRYFDRERILVLASEELRTARADALRRVLAFIGVDETWSPPSLDVELNTAEQKRVPRLGSRMLGYVVIRGRLQPVVPRRLVAMRQRQSRLLMRGYRPDETVVPLDVRTHLVEALREDVVRLRDWLGPDFHCWGLG